LLRESKRYIKIIQISSVVIMILGVVTFTSLIFYTQKNGLVLYSRGSSALEEKKYHEAVKYLKQALDEGFDFERIAMKLAIAYTKINSLENAILVLSKNVSLGDTSLPTLRMLAGCYETLGRVEDSLRLYEQQRQSLQKDPTSLFYLANLYKRMRRFEEARSLYRKLLVRKDVDRKGLLIAIAETYSWDGNHEKASSLYQILVNEYKGDISLKVAYARSLLWSGEQKKSEKEYSRIYALYKKNSSVLNPKNSISNSDKNENSNLSIEPILEYTLLLSTNKVKRKSLLLVKDLMQKESDIKHTLLLSKIYYSLGFYHKAYRNLRRYQHEREIRNEEKAFAANVILKTGRYNEAEKNILQFLDYAPKAKKQLFEFTINYLSEGKSDLPELWFKRYAEVLREHPRVILAYGQFLMSNKRSADAYKLLKEYTNVFRENKNLQYSFAQVASWVGKREESIKTYEKLLQVDQNNKQLRREYARVLSWEGKHKAAASQLQKTLYSDFW
jgi:predicted Zn-dependent protease